MSAPRPAPVSTRGSLYAQRAKNVSGSAIRALFSVASRPEVVSLAGGMPYVQALSMDHMADVAARVVREQGARALQYGSGQGDIHLREQILDITAEVGVRAHPDDIIVTTGSQMALDLVTRTFCDPGDVVLVESPSYVGALGVFRSYECDIVHVAMDDDGLVPNALRETIESVRAQGKRIKLLYTIPSFHNPAGVTQPAERRREILEIAQSAGIAVLEDDPYGLWGSRASHRVPCGRTMIKALFTSARSPRRSPPGCVSVGRLPRTVFGRSWFSQRKRRRCARPTTPN